LKSTVLGRRRVTAIVRHLCKIMLRHLVPLLALFAITLAACGCSDHPASRSAHEKTDSLLGHIDGTRFVSTEKFEAGLGEDGPEMGHWYLSFKGGTVTWDFSDTQWSGTFAIAADGKITASMGSHEISGTFDPKTRILLWDDKRYEPVADGNGA